MRVWSQVAGFAVGVAGVIEFHFQPVFVIQVAVGAFAWPVAFDGFMADGAAIIKTNKGGVVDRWYRPWIDWIVAGSAVAWIVSLGWSVAVRTCDIQIGDFTMVYRGALPCVFDRVARRALQRPVTRWARVAVGTGKVVNRMIDGYLCPFIDAVAAGALTRVMRIGVVAGSAVVVVGMVEGVVFPTG